MAVSLSTPVRGCSLGLLQIRRTCSERRLWKSPRQQLTRSLVFGRQLPKLSPAAARQPSRNAQAQRMSPQVIAFSGQEGPRERIHIDKQEWATADSTLLRGKESNQVLCLDVIRKFISKVLAPALLLAAFAVTQALFVGRAYAAKRPIAPVVATSVTVEESSGAPVTEASTVTVTEVQRGAASNRDVGSTTSEGILSETSFDELQDRWTLSPKGFFKALDNNLLDRTVWRWDDSAIRCRVKGGDQEYHVDLTWLGPGEADALKDRLQGVALDIGYGSDWPRNAVEDLDMRYKKGILHESAVYSAQEVAGGLERSGNFGLAMCTPADPRGGYKKDPFIFVRAGIGFLVPVLYLLHFNARPRVSDGQGFVLNKRVFDIFKRLKQQTQRYRPTTVFSDIGGLDSVMEELQETVEFLKNPSRYDFLGARPPRGLLLVGAPGTGKTMLAEAIAGEAAVNILFVDARQFMHEENDDALVGVQAGRIRDLFKSAREQGPCILFIDEIDVIARRAYNAQDGPQEADLKQTENESCINQLLVELDGFNTGKEAGVVVMGASNRPDILDPALTRPGRMDRVIEMPLPDKVGRRKILDIYAKGTVLAKDVDMDEIAAQTSGMTGAELSMIFEEADWRKVLNMSDGEFAKLLPGWLAMHPGVLLWKLFPYWLRARMIRNRVPWLTPGKQQWGYQLSNQEVMYSVDFIKSELFSDRKVGSWGPYPDRVWTREFLTPHAVWAGSSSLVATLLGLPVQKVELARDRYKRDAVASVMLSKWEEAGDTEYSSRAWAEKQLVMLCTPYMAQQLLQKEEDWTDIPAKDLKEARKLARVMLLREGWGPEDSVMVWWGGSRDEWLKMDTKTGAMVMSRATRKSLNQQVEQMIETSCKAAWRMLTQHEPLLRDWVDTILTKQKNLSGKEFKAWLRAKGATFEEDFMLFPPGTHASYTGENGSPVSSAKAVAEVPALIAS